MLQVVSACAFFGSAATLVWAVVGRRPRSPRCPRCGYGRADAADLTRPCSECGFVAIAAGDWLLRKRHWAVATVAAVVALASLWPIAGRPAVSFVRSSILPTWKTEFEGRAAGYRVRIDGPAIDTHFGRRVVVTAPDGTVAMTLPAFYPELGAHSSAVGPNAPPRTSPQDDEPGFGADVDDDGRPDLVVECPSGGSGGGLTTYVYRLESEGVVPAAVLENLWIERGPRDTASRAVGFDATLAYRWTSGAGSPRPKIVLKSVKGTWTLDHDAMSALVPTDAEIGEARRAIAAADPNSPSTDQWRSPLLRIATRLLYGGKTSAARDFVRSQWRGSADEVAMFEHEFRAAFDESPYARELREIASEQGDIRWP